MISFVATSPKKDIKLYSATSRHFSMVNSKKHFLPQGAGDGNVPHVKRIRGGGYNDNDFEKEELYHEDDIEEVEDFADQLDVPNEYIKTIHKSDMNAEKLWKRPPLQNPTNEDSLDLQWLDIDMISGSPLSSNPNKSKKNILGSTTGPVPIIRIFGVTMEGHSVCACIHGFTPYAYFAIPADYKMEQGNSHETCEKIRQKLNQVLKDSQRYNQKNGDGETKFCHGVEYVDGKQSIMGYNTSHKRFLKVYVAMPTMVPTLKRVMEEGMNLPGMISKSGENINVSYQPFECNVPFVLRFMIDRGITGAGWLSLPPSTYSLKLKESEKRSHCQLEVDVFYNEVIPRESVGEWSKIAKLRILSLDIECQGRKGHFPEAEKDPVIQIANVVKVYGDEKPIVNNVFTLKGCLPIVGAQVISSDSEEELLMKWRSFLQACDPDIITGYNVQNFDLPYILDRVDALSKKKTVIHNISLTFIIGGE